jgi:hypothetical protein
MSNLRSYPPFASPSATYESMASHVRRGGRVSIAGVILPPELADQVVSSPSRWRSLLAEAVDGTLRSRVKHLF